jgi:hypothetical protein
MEVIKYIVGKKALLEDRLLMRGGLHMNVEEIAIGKNPDCKDCGNRNAEV